MSGMRIAAVDRVTLEEERRSDDDEGSTFGLQFSWMSASGPHVSISTGGLR
jgi:hypothetical protein